MATETKVLTAHVPLGLAEKVEAMASRLERSRGWVVKQALAAWVDQEEERHRMTLEALEDVGVFARENSALQFVLVLFHGSVILS